MKNRNALATLWATTAVALLSATLLTAAPPAAAQDGCAQVEVLNIRPQQGHLMLVAYASADTWRKQPLTQLRLAAGDSTTMRFAVCGLAGAGEVALMLFQDLDSDGRLGTNVVGMPTEPWGSSGTPGTFGPSWDTGRVKLDGRLIVVRMSQ
ncbi:MAG: DUF2141 domain-containing protein [Aquabacterium sp.]